MVAAVLAASLATSVAWVLPPGLPSPAEGRAQLFAGRDVLEFELAAPLEDLFASADRNPDASVRGRLSYLDPASRGAVVIDGIELSVRGNSSRRFTECPFPKLKLKLPKAPAGEGTIFHDIRALKIGTHCDDRPDGQLTFQFGRWPNEKSPVREALVYRLLEVAQVAVPLTRPARITYVYGAGGSKTGGPAPRSMTRNALLLEDEADAMVRLGATGELIVPGGEPASHGKAAGTFENAKRSFSALESARVAFAEAMIGNFDWALRFHPGDGYRDDGRKGLWNVWAFARADGTAFPFIQDFDLAGIVTGRHRWYGGVFPRRFGEAVSEPGVEVLAQVQRTRSLFDRDVLDAIRTEFLGRKAALLSVVGDLPVDPGGRANADAYLSAFFDAIASDGAFYRPVVTRTDVVPWASEDGALPLCAEKDRVPIGTPVAAPAPHAGALARVELLDVFWYWANKCDAVRKSPAWIRADAIEKAYPSK